MVFFMANQFDADEKYNFLLEKLYNCDDWVLRDFFNIEINTNGNHVEIMNKIDESIEKNMLMEKTNG